MTDPSRFTHIRRADTPTAVVFWCEVVGPAPSISEGHLKEAPSNPAIRGHIKALPEPLCDECLMHWARSPLD